MDKSSSLLQWLTYVVDSFMEKEHSLYPTPFLTGSAIISEKTCKRMGIGDSNQVHFLSMSSQRIERNKANTMYPVL